MREARGNLWDFHAQGHWVAITTNGAVKQNGECVMGRGCALEAKTRFPGLARELGRKLQEHGNFVFRFTAQRLVSFPVKHLWHQAADLDLIRRSAHGLMKALDAGAVPAPVYLPRPGCGNGQLTWEQVKPVLEGVLDDRVVVVTF